MNIRWKNKEMNYLQARGLLLTRRSHRICRTRKSKTYFLYLMLIVCTVCQAQKLSIKPYINYHQSISSQEAPVFYTIGYIVSQTPVNSSSIEDFTLANGLEYGLSIDYTFRNQLGFELGLGYFSSQNNLFSSKKRAGTNSLTTDWDYHSIAVRPLFSYAVINGKSTFIGKIGPAIHYASATINAFYGDQKLPTCTFDNKLNWGYSAALEWNYQLSEQFSMAMELGFERYKYSPNKATVKDEKASDPAKKEYEIHYVNEIVYETGWNRDLQWVSIPSQTKRLKESILFNSIYIGIGIKYNLWENGKTKKK